MELSKRNKISIVLIILCIIISTVLITILANTYFSESIFYINQHKYKQENAHNNMVKYHARSDAPSVEVSINDQNRKVSINNEEYSILNYKSVAGNTFEVSYPSGHTYEVVDQSGFFMAYDEKKEYVPEISLYVNGERILQEGDEEYYPSELVVAAYPEYHTKQGSLPFFILSFFLLIYGWCGFRYEKFQNFQFLLSLRWIWVNDAEPSDFYYFMCKVGGVLVMIGSVVLAIKSLFM